MKNAAWAAAGALLGVVLVLGTGILTMQRIGLKAGAVLGLDNQVMGVTQPTPALLHLVMIAVLNGLVLLALTVAVRNRARMSQQLFRGGFAFATAALVLGSWAMLADDYRQNGLRQGLSPWWQGWLEEGGGSSVVHLVLLVALGVLWWQRDPVRHLERRRMKRMPPPQEDLF